MVYIYIVCIGNEIGVWMCSMNKGDAQSCVCCCVGNECETFHDGFMCDDDNDDDYEDNVKSVVEKKMVVEVERMNASECVSIV